MERRLDRVDAQMAGLVLVWGSAFLGITVLSRAGLDPFQITWYRYAPILLLYGGWLAWRGRAQMAAVSGGDWARMALLGFLGVIGYHFTLNWGLHDAGDGVVVTSATASILVATVPLWTLVLSVVRRKERFRPASALGFLVAFVGVAVVVLLGRGAARFDLAGKALLVLLAPLSWGIYTSFSKGLVDRHGGLFVTAVTMCLGTLMVLPLGVGYGVAPLAMLDGEAWAWLLFLSIVSTAAGYAVWNDALKHRKASEVAVFVYAQPIVTAVLAAWYLREALTPYFALGAALILAGVVLVNRARWTAAASMKP